MYKILSFILNNGSVVCFLTQLQGVDKQTNQFKVLNYTIAAIYDQLNCGTTTVGTKMHTHDIPTTIATYFWTDNWWAYLKWGKKV